MATIHKAVLEMEQIQHVNVPHGAYFLTAQIQLGKICVWYECVPQYTISPRRIAIVATGGQIPSGSVKYLGTVQLQELVFHIYELDA